MTLTKIISGGQTGADQGALCGAALAGLETGGTAPKGYWTEDGAEPTLLGGYGLGETLVTGYAPRTRINVMNSDGTLVLGNWSSRGSELTRRFCRELKKSCLCITWPFKGTLHIRTVAEWLSFDNIKTLNVAGNRESRNPGIYEATSCFIIDLVKHTQGGL